MTSKHPKEAHLTTILTLALEDEAQQAFEAQRTAYFPPARNHIPAHLSLFHSLPGDANTHHILSEAAARQPMFTMQVDGVRSMGRGVLYTLVSPELLLLHRRLASSFEPSLIPQDRQPFRPHIVVQNKVEPAEAKALLAKLQSGFKPRNLQAMGLLWWEYLGGPWRLIEDLRFTK